MMMIRLFRTLSGVILTLALTGACGCETFTQWLDSLEGRTPKSTAEPEQQAVYFDVPRVRPGVALSISVTAAGVQGREQKQYFVDAEGCISMELVGQVKCNGLTLVELQTKVTEAYKKYYRDPSVMATFLYSPGSNMVSPWGTVTVLGEVHKPGPVDVPQTMDLTVTRALMMAGGVTSIANKSKVKVTRCDKDGKQTKTIVDLEEIGREGRREKDMLLKGGDVIWVPISFY